MRSVTATMIGRGATDAEIRSACAPYCTGGFDETDLDDFLDRGAGEVERARRGLGRAAGAADVAQIRPAAQGGRQGAWHSRVGARRHGRRDARGHGQKEEVDDQIAQINAEYALVLAGNKAAVMKFEDTTKFRLLQVGAFKQWFANQLVMVGKDGRFAWRLLAGPHGAAAICRHRVRAAGHRRSTSATTISGRGLPSSPGKATARSFWRI